MYTYMSSNIYIDFESAIQISVLLHNLNPDYHILVSLKGGSREQQSFGIGLGDPDNSDTPDPPDHHDHPYHPNHPDHPYHHGFHDHHNNHHNIKG